ncbi:MAG TPA: hypothetical protein VJ837_04550 [Candidatus Paceibacterota bacterium]|nr:hypothetical protein [Candidatus Paceibacterota bacterium]
MSDKDVGRWVRWMRNGVMMLGRLIRLRSGQIRIRALTGGLYNPFKLRGFMFEPYPELFVS